MAADLVRMHPLKILKPPVEISGFTMCQGWHKIHGNDPGHRCLSDAPSNTTLTFRLRSNGLRPPLTVC